MPLHIDVICRNTRIEFIDIVVAVSKNIESWAHQLLYKRINLRI